MDILVFKEEFLGKGGSKTGFKGLILRKKKNFS